MSIARNRKAFFNYEILEKFEAGIVLRGNEVKSIRNGKVNIAEGFITVKQGEAYIHNMTIQPYDKSSTFAAEATRERKLLLHKNEINRLFGKAKEKGLTVIPLNIYFKKNKVKMEIGLGKGKKLTDKRDSLKKKSINREIERELKSR
ncbi:MAG: SsrA-binding protein SmpB [Candidatus Margulisbacteria bacterium]|nr:SsrA-binding protein SmpB [Candidatus Margulisiibacteriota bacterium]